jgi:hypothetical protein
MMWTKSVVPLLGACSRPYTCRPRRRRERRRPTHRRFEGWHIPEGAATERNPEPLNAACLAKGQSLYKSKCPAVSRRGRCRTRPEADPNHPAGDLTDGRRAARNPDGVMFYKIWNGREKPKMPAMKTDITRAEVWTVIHYVKTLRK